jgi:myo-inositol-1(or 4)-monophosphatase
MVVRNALQANDTAVQIDKSLARAALAAAVKAAERAARVIRDAAPGLAALEWVEKGTADFVTEVDKAAEAAIAETIAESFPDAMLVGEELTPGDGLFGDGLTFIADPLDGTTNFLHAYPQYAVSIGVLNGRELIAAVVLNVPRGDLFTASVGDGTWLNGEIVRVSTTKNPSRALIGTGFPFKNPDLLDQYARQFIAINRRTAGIRRAGSAALDLADVACGRFDGFWELVLAPWDTAAGLLLVREAGGIVTDASGAPCIPSHGAVVAGNADIHPWLLNAIQEADSPESVQQ